MRNVRISLGLSLVPKKGEGDPVTYDARLQGPTKRWTHDTFALGYADH